MERTTGKQIAEEMCNVLNREDRQQFVETISRQHRSLQQQTIGLLMEVVAKFAEMRKDNDYDLRNDAATKLCDEIYEAFGDKFHMPFI